MSYALSGEGAMAHGSLSVKNFVENVINNPAENKKAKKTIDNYKLSIPAGVVIHSINKHDMTAEDWEEVTNNIDNIFIANKSNKNNAYSQDNYKVGIKTQNGNFYALTIGLNDFDNYICTAFKSTEKGVESFVTDKGKTPSKVHTESSKNLSVVAPLSKESSNNIINYLKKNFNPKLYNEPLFQSANIAGAETSAEISDAKVEYEQKGVDSKFFKKWFKKSKVVDGDGRPLIVYRGDVATFAIFLKDKASPEGDMGAGFYCNC